jgi:hypothetical protein
MGILQGLIAYLRKSAGKLVQAIFGWAVRALFGTVAESEKTLLSVIVGAAAAWPVLLVGIPFPKIAALLLAFVPIPKWVSPGWIRVFWIVAAFLVPAAVGLALARRGKSRRSGPRWKTFFQGFPVTAAISAGFLTAFVTAPVRRLLSLARRREELTVPLLVRPHEYDATAEVMRATLEAGGVRLRREKAPWLRTAPQRVVRAIGGRALGDQLPKKEFFYRNEALDLMVTPYGVTLEGEKDVAARAHGWVCEKATLGPGLQAVDAEAQRLEKILKDIWAVYARDPESHAGSAVLLDAIDALTKELEKTVLSFEDWQVLYREMLQVSRAIEGKTQLLGTETEEAMDDRARDKERPAEPGPAASSRPEPAWPPRPGRGVTSLSTPRLVSGLTGELKGLIEKEIALAKAEIRVDLESGLKSAKWLGISAALALCFLNMLFVALALVLAKWMALPVAALAVAGALLLVTVVAALRAKAAFVKPLETTRKTIDEGWTWAKNRIA